MKQHVLLMAVCAAALSGCAIHFEFGPAGSVGRHSRPEYVGPGPQGPVMGPPVGLAPPQGGVVVAPAQPGTGTTIEHRPQNPRAYRCNADGTRAVPPNHGTGWCEPKG